MTPTKRHPERPPPDESEDSLEVTAEDILWIRQQRRQHEHEKWLRGQIKVLWPWVVAAVSVLVALGSGAMSLAKWASEHVKL